MNRDGNEPTGPAGPPIKASMPQPGAATALEVYRIIVRTLDAQVRLGAILGALVGLVIGVGIGIGGIIARGPIRNAAVVGMFGMVVAPLAGLLFGTTLGMAAGTVAGAGLGSIRAALVLIRRARDDRAASDWDPAP
jgi:hypothetical protein